MRSTKNTTRLHPYRTHDRGCDRRYLAAVAIPAYSDYTSRAKVTEGLSLASGIKSTVAEQCECGRI